MPDRTLTGSHQSPLRRRRGPTAAVLPAALLVLLLAASGCRQDMHDQPSQTALEASAFFADGRSSRPPVTGTVARGHLVEDPHLTRGRIGEAFAKTFPFEITMQTMERGRERYGIFCSPCHDALGTGRGMVVRRGFSQAASFHIDRLRNVENGYLFDVVTNGFGRMAGYAGQIPVRDRWTIVAYVRALQLSQNFRADQLDDAGRAQLARSEESR